MTQAEAIAEARRSFESHIKAVAEEIKNLDGPALVWAPDASAWSILQIADHLLVTHHSYLERMRQVIDQSSPADAASPYTPTWIGRTLRRAAGPGGNAPAPKMFHPRRNPPREVLDELILQWRELMVLCDACQGRSVTRPAISTPMSPVPKMSVVDALLLHADHGLRHLEQMRDRVRASQLVPAP